MDVGSYRNLVFKTLSVADAKKGLRTMSSNTRMMNIGHAMVGVTTEVGELLQATQQFVVGFQMTDTMRDDVREELGDISYYMTVGAKMLKVRLPASSKKVKAKGTMTELLMEANSISTDLLSLYKKSYYGRGLGEGSVLVDRTPEELEKAAERAKVRAARLGQDTVTVKTTKRTDSPSKDEFLAQVRHNWEKLVQVVYALSWSILQQPIGEVMDANIDKLITGPNARYKDAEFSAEAAEARADKKSAA